MKHSYKIFLLALIIISAFLVGCEPDEGANPTPVPPTTDPDLVLQNACIRVDDPDPEMRGAIRLTNTCEYEVNVKFCIDPRGAGRPECSNPDTPALSPEEWTRAFPEAQEYALKMGVCKAIDNSSYFYDPEFVEFRDGQECGKKEN